INMSANFALSARIGTVSIIGACAVFIGCGGDSSDPEPGQATNTTNPGVGNTSTMTSSTSGAGGNAAASTSTTGGTSACSMTAPPNETISDFSDWVGGDWGSDVNLTGGSFGPYMGDNTEEFDFV